MIKKITDFLVQFAGHEVLEGTIRSVLNLGVEGGKHLMKSNFSGFGTNDERLFQSACAYAVLEHKVPIADLNKVIKVISSFSDPIRSRIVEIIGKDEQTITIKKPVFDDNHQLVTDKKGKTVEETVTLCANVQGGNTLLLMSKMNDTEIREYIKASGSADVIDLKEKGKKFTEFLNNKVLPVAQDRRQSIDVQAQNWADKLNNLLR